MELFATDPLIGAGLPLWLPAGAAARHAIEEYIREEERRAGYQHVYSPPLAKPEMYRRSGHLPYFAEDMFPPMAMGADPSDELVLRPSLCPHHAMVYRSRGRSYRELPLRVAELGGMYRAERSGVLGGLARVRSIQLNDAHNFCAPDQLPDELAAVLAMVGRAHAALGLQQARIRLSLRGQGGKYAGEPAVWNRAEGVLRDALVSAGLAFVEAPGEAACYGPKIDVQIADAAGRDQTLSTIQVDFHQPANFDLSYVDCDGDRRQPVMVHRSVVGSLERLFAHLIEVHEGAFPAWYAPVQLVALPVADAQASQANAFVAASIGVGLRAEASCDGSLDARIREAAGRRVPYVAVIGPREAAAGQASLRLRDGRRLDPMPEGAAIGLIRQVVEARSRELMP